LISVVVGTYNRADDLDRCIASVLAQPGDDFEILVGDDGSPDHTPEVIQRHSHDLRLRTYRNPVNLGMQGNMFKVVYESRGEFVFILTDDDYMLPGALAKVADVIRQHPDVGYILSDLPTVDERTGKVVNLHRTFRQSQYNQPGLESVAQIAGSAWVLSRQVLRRDWIDWATWQQFQINIFFPIIVAGRMLLCAPSYYLAENLVMHTWFNKVHWEAFGPNDLQIEFKLAADRYQCMRAILHDQPLTPAVADLIERWEDGNFRSYLYLSHRGFFHLIKALGVRSAYAQLRQNFVLGNRQRYELRVFTLKIIGVRLWVNFKSLLNRLPQPVRDRLKLWRRR
jgi:glycosyltransferase involved in cell wall biosynthesis